LPESLHIDYDVVEFICMLVPVSKPSKDTV